MGGKCNVLVKCNIKRENQNAELASSWLGKVAQPTPKANMMISSSSSSLDQSADSVEDTGEELPLSQPILERSRLHLPLNHLAGFLDLKNGDGYVLGTNYYLITVKEERPRAISLEDCFSTVIKLMRESLTHYGNDYIFRDYHTRDKNEIFIVYLGFHFFDHVFDMSNAIGFKPQLYQRQQCYKKRAITDREMQLCFAKIEVLIAQLNRRLKSNKLELKNYVPHFRVLKALPQAELCVYPLTLPDGHGPPGSNIQFRWAFVLINVDEQEATQTNKWIQFSSTFLRVVLNQPSYGAGPDHFMFDFSHSAEIIHALGLEKLLQLLKHRYHIDILVCIIPKNHCIMPSWRKFTAVFKYLCFGKIGFKSAQIIPWDLFGQSSGTCAELSANIYRCAMHQLDYRHTYLVRVPQYRQWCSNYLVPTFTVLLSVCIYRGVGVDFGAASVIGWRLSRPTQIVSRSGVFYGNLTTLLRSVMWEVVQKIAYQDCLQVKHLIITFQGDFDHDYFFSHIGRATGVTILHLELTHMRVKAPQVVNWSRHGVYFHHPTNRSVFYVALNNRRSNHAKVMKVGVLGSTLGTASLAQLIYELSRCGHEQRSSMPLMYDLAYQCAHTAYQIELGNRLFHSNYQAPPNEIYVHQIASEAAIFFYLGE